MNLRQDHRRAHQSLAPHDLFNTLADLRVGLGLLRPALLGQRFLSDLTKAAIHAREGALPARPRRALVRLLDAQASARAHQTATCTCVLQEHLVQRFFHILYCNS